MDALTLLHHQHQLVDDLFSVLEDADSDERRTIFEDIADLLAIHAAIEERHFYPIVRQRATEGVVDECMTEHLEMKSLLLDCLQSMEGDGFDDKLALLHTAVRHHVEEEESELFPRVRELFDADALESVGQQLEAETEEMKSGAPREEVRVELEPPEMTT